MLNLTSLLVCLLSSLTTRDEFNLWPCVCEAAHQKFPTKMARPLFYSQKTQLTARQEANKEKEEFFRQLYSLNEVSDDEDTSDGEELRDISRKNRLSKPPPSSSFSIPPETSQERSQERGRPQSQPPTITPLIHRTTSAPVSSVSIVKETPLLRGRSSLLRSVFTTPTPGVPSTETSKIEATPAERPQPERSASTPNIGSVIMTNSMGIASMLNKKPIVNKKRKRRSNEVKLVPEGERILANMTFFYVPNDEVAPLRRSRIEKALEYGAKRTPGVSASLGGAY